MLLPDELVPKEGQGTFVAGGIGISGGRHDCYITGGF